MATGMPDPFGPGGFGGFKAREGKSAASASSFEGPCPGAVAKLPQTPQQQPQPSPKLRAKRQSPNLGPQRSPHLGPASSAGDFEGSELERAHRGDGNGRFIENPRLTQLSAMLKAIDAGDRIIKGRLELFACSRKRLSVNQQLELERRAPDSAATSPLGPMVSDSSQILLSNLRVLMSLLFVDYDCANLTPDDFEHCPDKHAVVSFINHNLASVVDRVHAGFLAEFWQRVQDAIDIVGCDIFAFKPTSGSFGPTDNSLMSFHYFLVDLPRGRILFIGSVTKSRGAIRGGAESDSDVMLSQDSASSVTSKGRGSSDMGSSLQEGEFAFSDGSDGMMD